MEAYRKRTGRDPLGYFAIGDGAAIVERIAAYIDTGATKFILRPVAEGVEDMLAQTRLLLEEVLPEVARRWPKPK
jgi:alkanesulfonate monooxygenase SsuD/methylene tetrahydromethanopterin reductase-like flavin-dependent oxidoreductase (luciferase family)